MKSPASSLRKSLTHAGFFAGGLALGFVVWKSVGQAVGKSASGDKAPSAKEQRVSDRRSERPEAFKSGTEILRIVAPYVFEERDKTSQGMSYAKYLRDGVRQILDAADKLPPAEDVAAAAKELMEKSESFRGVTMTPEDREELRHFNSRLVHWLRADPEAALNYLSDHRAYMDTGSAVYAVMSEKGIDAAMGWLKFGNSRIGENVGNALSLFVGTSGDIGQVEKLRQTLTPAQWSSLKADISYAWPIEKADEIFNFAVSENSPMMVARMAAAKGKEGADWLMKQIASDTLDPAFKDAITNSREFQQMMRSNPHLPLETRLEYLSKSEPNKDKEQLAMEVGSRDVSNALDDASRDWRFAFKNGKVTFEEVYEAVVADLPSLAAGSPDAIRLQVFKELAEENGTAALEALAHTPEPDKWTLALKPTQWMFHGIDPQKFYDYLQKIPHQDPVHYQARLESWVSHSSGHLAAYSRDYVTWVKDMPQGLDREMAAVGILRTLAGSSDKALKAEVDALVVDPSLRARIIAQPPVKK